MSTDGLDDEALEQLAKQLGLEQIHAENPDLIRKAYDAARLMAERLPRPDDVTDEPAHTFKADNNV